MERHLDLTPLGGRRHGVTRCIFHQDDRPSFSVDLDRGLFNCFSCGAQGGLKKFAELVGEAPASTRARGGRPPESDRQRARREVLARERRAAAKRAEWADWSFANNYVRRCSNAARDARQVATRLGPDHTTWA